MMFFVVDFILIAIGFMVFRNISIMERIKGFQSMLPSVGTKKKTTAVAAVAFMVSFIPVFEIFKSVIFSVAVSLLPAFCVYAVLDVIGRFREQKERSQITRFVASMAKWSSIRNDIVYCLSKTIDSGMENPTQNLVRKAVGRINGGMDVILAIRHMENECRSDDMKYMFRNIRFAAEKGGNLRNLFTSMEKQFFMIDEEFFRRKISTARDRTAVYSTVVMVVAVSVFYLAKNPTATGFYINTDFGNVLLLVFSVVFSMALILMLRK